MKFITVGNHVINIDHITHVDILDQGFEAKFYASVHMVGGSTISLNEAEYRLLLSVLQVGEA